MNGYAFSDEGMYRKRMRLRKKPIPLRLNQHLQPGPAGCLRLYHFRNPMLEYIF
jgi:hypothetical protein